MVLAGRRPATVTLRKLATLLTPQSSTTESRMSDSARMKHRPNQRAGARVVSAGMSARGLRGLLGSRFCSLPRAAERLAPRVNHVRRSSAPRSRVLVRRRTPRRPPTPRTASSTCWLRTCASAIPMPMPSNPRRASTRRASSERTLRMVLTHRCLFIAADAIRVDGDRVVPNVDRRIGIEGLVPDPEPIVIG